MSLKELTADLHDKAEKTAFMQSVMKKTLPLDAWADFTYQKTLFYNVIERCASVTGLLADLPGIDRTFLLYQDYKEMTQGSHNHSYKQSTLDYYNYVLGLHEDKDKVMAHLYVWHMGDLFGGQMIKKIINAPHRALDFKDPDLLKQTIRSKLNDNMAPEARVAFEWAIKIMNETYE